MTTIFISHAKENADCAEQIRQRFEIQGYGVKREPVSLSTGSILFSRSIERAILGSTAVILVWSSSAAQSEWVERHILFAQQLKKPIWPVLLDATPLPTTLRPETTIINTSSCTDVAAQLLPSLPPANSTDPLIVFAEHSAHEHIHLRKEAIAAAAEMLQHGEHRESVLAVLEYLALNDQMTSVREKAQEVLESRVKKAPPPPQQSRHSFGVKCRNGHITYFDKRDVCPKQEELMRKQIAGTGLDELDLPCRTCGLKVTVHIDCRGYR